MVNILAALNYVWSKQKIVNEMLTKTTAAAGRLFKQDYNVVVVNDLRDALDFLSENNGEVSLVIADMLLPAVTKIDPREYPDFPDFPDYAPGLGLLKYVNQRHPQTQFIIVSVYLNDYLILKELEEREKYVIAQIDPAAPFWHQDLKEAIRSFP